MRIHNNRRCHNINRKEDILWKGVKQKLFEITPRSPQVLWQRKWNNDGNTRMTGYSLPCLITGPVMHGLLDSQEEYAVRDSCSFS
ncbi:hypothetical protein TNCV_1993101 [Trichonephila clavipes]|nr:hypothetical protein TNCV_1993101 [Trichonephila clavipes]